MTEVCECAKGFAKCHIDGLAAASNGGAHRSFVQDAGSFDGLDRFIGHASGVAFREDLVPHINFGELDMIHHSRGFKDMKTGAGDFWTDSVAGSERDGDLLRHVG